MLKIKGGGNGFKFEDMRLNYFRAHWSGFKINSDTALGELHASQSWTASKNNYIN